MRFPWRSIVAALLTVVATGTADAQLSPEDAEICREVGAQGLECFVWLDANAAMADYEKMMVTNPPETDIAFAPFFLMPRYQAAIGQPGFAFAAITEWLKATASNEYELWGNPSAGLYVTAAELTTDPLPSAIDTEPPQGIGIEDPDIRGDAMIAAGRLLARAGEIARANAIFTLALDIARETAQGDMWQRAGHVERLFAMWAASGLAVNANEAARNLAPVDSALARLAVVEGLALTADAEATAAAAQALPGWLPLLGEMAVAEAWRRQGQTDAARATLDRAAQELENAGGEARTDETYRRLAQGYALLGDTARAGELLVADPQNKRLRDGLAWTDIAPMVACHDLAAGLELAGDDPVAIADVLTAAAASGQGEAAHGFATGRSDTFERALYLVATVIGLRHARLVDDPDLPCASVTVVGTRDAAPG